LKQDIFIFVGNAPGFLVSIWLNLQAVKLQYDSFRLQETRKSIIMAFDEAREATSEFLLNRKDNGTTTGTCTTNKEEDTDTQYIFSHASQIVSKVNAPAMIAPAHHEKLVLANAIVWIVVVAIISYATTFDSNTKELIVGIVVNLNLVVFYAAPLSVIYKVITQRTSDSIHICTMITNTLNGSFWAVYGLAITDPLIYVTNSLGAGLGIVQIILCLLFPRKKGEASAVKLRSNGNLVEESQLESGDRQSEALPK
jgi:solute carrier family 50 (sugar transporter)